MTKAKKAKPKLKELKFRDPRSQFLLQQRQINFMTGVEDYTAQDFLWSLEYLNSLNNKPITVIINSGGGYVDAGIAMYDAIKASRSPIHIRCVGKACSMAAVILAGGNKGYRTISPNSRVMIHQPSGGYTGKSTDFEVAALESARIKKLLAKLLSEDTGKAFNKVLKDMEKDLWMDANQTLEYGLVDEIK